MTAALHRYSTSRGVPVVSAVRWPARLLLSCGSGSRRAGRLTSETWGLASPTPAGPVPISPAGTNQGGRRG